MEEKTEISWKTISTEAKNKVEAKGWPKPSKPSFSLDTLEFPEDIDKISSLHLATVAMRFQGWYAYITTELSYTKAEQAVIEELYLVKIAQKAYDIQKINPSKITVAVLHGIVLNDEDIRPWFKVKLQKDQDVFLVEGLEAGLKIQCNAIRDEQIRRMSSQKLSVGS